jgi:Ca-activated chloride channel family protein
MILGGGSGHRRRALLALGLAATALALLAACTSDGDEPLEREDAVRQLSDRVDDVGWSEDFVTRRAKIEPAGEADLADSLPPISEFPLVVSPAVSSGDVVVEIFVSTEKSGTGTDGWIVEVADDFNAASQTLSDGRTAKVRIRKIASGIGYQFIASGKYRPDAFSPSNHLWIEMASAQGVEMTAVRDRLVGNVAGVVMKDAIVEELRDQYTTVDTAAVIDAVVQGRIVMGYTNPFASSTGLNFLVTVLASFGEGDEARMLAPDVASAFERFQEGVPFVALTTLQIRESVEQGGSLDAFVMEYQTFVNTSSLSSGFEFIPFGIRHENPLYGVGQLGAAERDALELFAAFSERSKYVDRATDFGFNPTFAYEPTYGVPGGETLVAAQRLWKEKKDAGRPVAAVFVADVSGSMEGSRIRGVQEALISGREFINPENSIGLVLFSDQVRVVLPIREFDLNQQAEFVAAVEDMDAFGGTAMYDAIVVGLNMLVDASNADSTIKPILFVLTDGETNQGLSFDSISRVIEGVRIPVYTIGYEANVEELKRLSSLVEAASLDAGEADVEYQIGLILNAEL